MDNILAVLEFHSYFHFPLSTQRAIMIEQLLVLNGFVIQQTNLPQATFKSR